MLGLLLACPGVTGQTAAVFADASQKLKQADAVRTAKPALFQQLMAELEQKAAVFTPQQADLYRYLNAYKLAYLGQLPQAVTAYESLFEDTSNIQIRYRSALSLVNLFAFQRQWLQGFKYLDFIFEHANNVADTTIRQEGLLVAAFFYNEMDQPESALAALERIKEKSTGRNRCLQLGLRVQALAKLMSPELSETDFDQAASDCREHGEELLGLIIRAKQAGFELARGQARKAEALIRAHLPAAKSSHYSMLTIELNAILAQALLEQGRYHEAREVAERAVSASEDPRYLAPLLTSHQVLYRVAEHNNNLADAITHLHQSLHLLKEQYEQNKAKSLALQLAKFKTQEKDTRIALLDQQNQILRLNNRLSVEKARRDRWLLIWFAAIIGLLFVWLWQARRSQRKLKYLSQHDSLTGISNRFYFRQAAYKLLSQLARQKQPASMIVFDLDHFNQVNDTYGHRQGDQVLRKAIRCCLKKLPPEALLGRIGGEEFAVLLPGMTTVEASKVAESCRAHMAATEMDADKRPFHFSASFGVADTQAAGHEFKTLISMADKAMYQAKKAGRNCVKVFDGSASDTFSASGSMTTPG